MNRRILMFVMIALASVSLCGATAYAQNKKVPRKQLKSLVNKYKGEDGFDGLNIGRLTMNMMRAAAKSEAGGDAESEAAPRRAGKILTFILSFLFSLSTSITASRERTE